MTKRTVAAFNGNLNETSCTCALIRRSARQITQAYDTALKDTGLRITQYSILANLDRHTSLSITDLSDVLVMDRTTLTRNLRPLQRDGLVRLGEGHDKRCKALCLTQDGKDALKRAKPLWHKTERALRQQIGEDNLQDLRQLLGRIA